MTAPANRGRIRARRATRSADPLHEAAASALDLLASTLVMLAGEPPRSPHKVRARAQAAAVLWQLYRAAPARRQRHLFEILLTVPQPVLRIFADEIRGLAPTTTKKRKDPSR